MNKPGLRLAAGLIAPALVLALAPSAFADSNVTPTTSAQATPTPTTTPSLSAEPTPEPSSPPTTPTKPAKPTKPVAQPSKSTKPSPSPSPSKKKDENTDPVIPQAQSWEEQGLGDALAGVDVSHWQHPGDIPIDWVAVRKAGVRWMYTKCSDGPDTAGDYQHWGPIDVVAAQKAGVMSGCYHYGQPGLGAADLHQSAIIQAKAAVLRQSTSNPRLPLTLDLEETGGLDSASISEWAYTFLTEVEKETGRTPRIYASSTFLMQHMADERRFHRFPVWVAAWGIQWRDESTPPQIPTWAKRAMWQFSSLGVVDGVAGIVDLDIAYLTPKQLRKLARKTPPPVAAPVVPPLVAMPAGPVAEPSPVPTASVSEAPVCADATVTASIAIGPIPHCS